MTTPAILKKWGKGIALVLPDMLVQEGRLATGNQVEVNLSGQRIKIRKTAATSEIEKMCEAITAENLHAETPWGAPQGGRPGESGLHPGMRRSRVDGL